MFTLPARSRLRALALVVALAAIAPALVAAPAEAILRTITNTSPPTVAVAPGAAPEVGSSVTASPGTWNPASGVTFAYQWLADGSEIANAKTSSLAVTSALLGKKLSVRVTGTGFLDTPGTATSAPTAAVQNPTIRNLSLPTVLGTPKTGFTLGSTTGTWSPGGATYTFQWLADGTAISGATGPGYTITPAVVAKKLAIRVTASKSGYQPGINTSLPSAAVLPGTTANTSVPTIYGDLRVGKTVGVNAGGWTPSGVAWTYRWFANGVLIPGVTTKTFVVDETLYGKSLKAEVTGTKPGYTSAVGVSATSKPLGCVVAKPTKLAKSSISSTGITIKWTKSFCATRYAVRYRLANATAWKTVSVGNVSRVRINKLLRARSYRMAVAAVGPDGGRSAFTSSILLKTNR